MGCGGGGKRTTLPSQTPDDAVRAAAVAGVTAFRPKEQCVQWLTARLIRRVYGGVSRCKRVVSDSSASPNFDANVIGVQVAGRRALVGIDGGNGDDRGI